MSGNNFEGPVPSMASNNNISNIQLSNNKLTGPIPKFENRLNLNYLYLDNNNLTQFNGFKGTSRLYQVYIQNNQITGEIPMLSGSSNSPNLNYFFANNNQFTSYASGSFAGLKNLYTLDISNNNLTAYDINNIIDDLYALYILTKRGYININIANQSGAVGYVPTATGTAREKEIYDKIVFLRSKRWTITIG
jgi:Leucine-rich repeat (LRR) protein